MGERDPGSFLALVKRTNTHYAKAAGISSEEEKEMTSLRSDIDEETYKFMLAPLLSHLLTQLVLANDKLPTQKRATVFNGGGSVPDISVQNYMDRIIKYCPCSPEAFICSLLLIDRLSHSKSLRITTSNVHRILLTSIMIATKLLDDCRWNNKYYSHVAGVSAKELLSLECRFLSMIDYSLHVSPQLFETYRYEIELYYVRMSLAERESNCNHSSRSTVEEPTKPEPSEDTKTLTTEAREKARLLTNKLKRSTSFNNSTSKKEIFNWRKRRSSSFTFLAEDGVSLSMPMPALTH